MCYTRAHTHWDISHKNFFLPFAATWMEETTLHLVMYGQDQMGKYRNQTGYILCSQRWRSSIQLTKTRPGPDCGSHHEHLIAKIRLKLKKVVKTTRPFSYGLNQIPHDYTVEVRNRFKGLDLIDRVPEELCMEVCEVTKGGD